MILFLVISVILVVVYQLDYDLGCLKSNESETSISEVTLPPWAEGKPEVFIYKHRKALESDYVSRHLPEWIDLIFGYKQKGPEAVKAVNVYQYYLYEGAFDLDKLPDNNDKKGIESAIISMGQVPSQLLKQKHPPRMTRKELLEYQTTELKIVPIFSCMDNLIQLSYNNFFETSDPLVFISLPPSQPWNYDNNNFAVVIVSKLGFVRKHSWMSTKCSGEIGHTFDTRGKHKFLGPLMPGIKASSNLYTTSPDAKFLYAAGQWDNSLTICQLSTNDLQITRERTHHTDVLSCLSYDTTPSSPWLITGSCDSTCVIWNLRDPAKPEHYKRLVGHHSTVTCVALYKSLDVAVSGSVGLIHIYSIETGRIVHKIVLDECCIQNIYVSIAGIIQVQWESEQAQVKEYHYNTYSINARLFGSDKICYKNDAVSCLCFLPKSQVIVGTANGNVVCTDGFERIPFKDITFSGVSIEAICLIKGNSHLLTALSDGRFVVTMVKTDYKR